MSNNVISIKTPHWNRRTVDEAHIRSVGAARVTLPIDQYLELLELAETALEMDLDEHKELQDKVLQDMGMLQPKMSKQHLREYFDAMVGMKG